MTSLSLSLLFLQDERTDGGWDFEDVDEDGAITTVT